MLSKLKFVKPNTPFDKSFEGCIAYKSTITIDKLSQSKILFCALGFGKGYINGKLISPDLLCSPISNYDKTLWVMEYDITNMLTLGQNEILFICSGGYYNEFVDTVWKLNDQPNRDFAKLACEIFIDNAPVDLHNQVWEYSFDTPYVFSSVRCGEHYDDRKSIINWQTAIIDTNPPKGIFRLCDCEPVRESEVYNAVNIISKNQNEHIFDFGINMAGYIQLNAFIPEGNEIVIKYVENISNDDIFDITNCEHYVNCEILTDKIIGGGKDITWSPSFSYHGFRYVKIIGLNKQNIKSIKAIRIKQQIKKDYTFNCSNEILNKLTSMVDNSVYSNMFYMLTDCPTREKLGWFNDAYGSTKTISYLYDVKKFFKVYMQNIVDAMEENGNFPCMIPSCEWANNTWPGIPMSAVLFELPYSYYKIYNDRSLLEKAYPYFIKHIEYEIARLNERGLHDKGLYDWVGPYDDIFHPPTPGELTCSAIFFHCLNIVVKSAELLNQDCQKIKKLKNTIKKKIISLYLNDDGESLINSQSALAILIHFGFYKKIIPLKKQLKKLIEQKNYHHDCGTIGIKFLYHALKKCKLNDYAYKIITAKGFPSYTSWIDKGETSLCETWWHNSSKNHHMFSSFMEWYIEDLLGIDNFNCGFNVIFFNPEIPKDIKYLDFSLNTIYGKLMIYYKKEGKKSLFKIIKPREIKIINKTNKKLNITIEESEI